MAEQLGSPPLLTPSSAAFMPALPTGHSPGSSPNPGVMTRISPVYGFLRNFPAEAVTLFLRLALSPSSITNLSDMASRLTLAEILRILAT